MSGIEQITRIARDIEGYLKAVRKKSGKRMIGVMHPVVPQEIIYAAGLHPIRLFPLIREPITLAQSHLHTYTSSIFRAIWDQTLKGVYSFLDGVVLPESCETVTFFARGWQWHRPGDFVTAIAGSRFKKTENAIDFFAKEIRSLSLAMDEFSGTKTSNGKFQEAVQVFNRNRELLRMVYELRKNDIPPLSGSETFDLCMASFVMDKEENNRLLDQIIGELNARKKGTKPKARLMVSGPCLVDRSFFEAVESSGAMIVADDTNTGSRSFWHTVVENGEPFASLARSYSTVPCPFTTSAEDRLRYISNMAKDFKVDGIIFSVEKWCESEKMDFPYLQKEIATRLGLPVTLVETEYLGDLAPIRTRVEGLVESISK